MCEGGRWWGSFFAVLIRIVTVLQEGLEVIIYGYKLVQKNS